MKLIELLEVIDDTTNVLVKALDENGYLVEVAKYDGKNSIDAELNGCEIIEVFGAAQGEIGVAIDCDIVPSDIDEGTMYTL